MAKYFGTDGIRGKYGEKLDEQLAYKTGLAIGEIYGEGTFVVRTRYAHFGRRA